MRFNGIAVSITNFSVVYRAIPRFPPTWKLYYHKPKSYEKENYILVFRIWLLQLLFALGLIHPDLFCVVREFVNGI